MNSTNDPNPDEVFLQVRSAYRLLHNYQRMVMDFIRYIGSRLNVDDYSIVEWRKPQNATKLDQSSWVWLPIFLGWVRFYKGSENNRSLNLSFLVISDTGFIDANDKVSDWDMVPDYAVPDKSSTKFAFIIHDLEPWDKIQPLLWDKLLMRNFVQTGNLPNDMVNAGFVGRCYDLSCLISKFKADGFKAADTVVEEIINLAKGNGWPLDWRKHPADQSKFDSNSADRRTTIQP